MFKTVKRAAASAVPILAGLCLGACVAISGDGNGGNGGKGGDRIPVYDVVSETLAAQAQECTEAERLAWYKGAVAVSDEDAAVHEVIPADCKPR